MQAQAAREVDVILFSYLAELAGGQRRVRCTGANAREALRDLVARYPRLESSLWEPGGHLSRALTLQVAGRDLAGPKGMDEPLSPGDEIVLLPLVTGG